MAIKYYIILTSYSNYQDEFIWNKAILHSHSWCTTFAFSHQKGWCWSVVSCASKYGLRPAYEQNYSSWQLFLLKLCFLQYVLSTPHLLATMAVFTLSETFWLYHHFSITWCWVTVYYRVSSTVLSCISTPLDCYMRLFCILMKFFHWPSTVQLWLWCLVACCTTAPLLFQAYDGESQ